jgi:drug/metabolite transporter (DMT)-like permease
MGTIITAIAIYWVFAKNIGDKAKIKGYDKVVFVVLVYLLFFGIALLSAYLLSLILDTNNDTIGTSVGIAGIVLGVVAAYFVPNLIIKKLPVKKIISSVKSNDSNINNQD